MIKKISQKDKIFIAGSTGMAGKAIKKVLLESGAWPFLKQRPYGIVADPASIPKALFVSTIDTAPLQVDFEFLLKNKFKAFQTGINVLSKLIGQSIKLGISPLEAENYKAFEKHHIGGIVEIERNTPIFTVIKPIIVPSSFISIYRYSL